METDCSKAKQNLVRLKTMKEEFVRLYEVCLAARDFSPLKSRKDEIKTLIEELKNTLDPYDLKLRHQLAKKLGAKLVEPFSEKKAVVIDAGLSVYFINRAGQRITAQNYISALPYSEGRAAVKIEGDDWLTRNSWVLIDEKGRQINGIKYRDVKPFSGGLAAVRDEEGWFYINRSGAPAIFPRQNKELRFAEAGPFHGMIAKVKIPSDTAPGYENCLINKVGEILHTDQYIFLHNINNRFSTVNLPNDKSLLIDKTTAATRKVSYAVPIADFKGENSKNIIIWDEHRKLSICDENGNPLSPKKYEGIGLFRDGLMAVKEKGEWILIDVEGRPVNIGEHEGWYSFWYEYKKEEIKLVMVENGRIVVKLLLNMEEIQDFDEKTNLIKLYKEDKKIVLLNWRGESVLETEGESLSIISENRFILRKGESGPDYLIDADGDEIIKADGIERFDSILRVKRDGLWSLHDLDGNMIGDSEAYESIYRTHENIIAQKQKKYYLLDKNFQIVGDQEGYDELNSHGDGVYRCVRKEAEQPDRVFYIDYRGRRFES